MLNPDINLYNKKNQNIILKGYKTLLYFTGSMIVNEPTNECISDFWTEGILNTLPVFSTNPRFVEAASQLRKSCIEKTTCLEMLKKDFSRLFDGQEKALAFPTKEFCTKNECSLTVKNPDDVSIFYSEYGWRTVQDWKVADNHLGTELLFLTYLIDKYTELDDGACRKEMRNEIRKFIDHQILSWITEWNERIQKHAQTLCYKGIATMIFACSEDIFEILENPGPAPEDHKKNLFRNQD